MISSSDEAIINQAITLHNNGKSQEALELMHSVQEQNHMEPGFNMIMTKIYYEIDQHEKCIEYSQRILQVKPQSELASMCTFLSFFELERVQEGYDEMFRFLETGKVPKRYLITLEEFKEQIGDSPSDENEEKVLAYYEQFFS